MNRNKKKNQNKDHQSPQISQDTVHKRFNIFFLTLPATVVFLFIVVIGYFYLTIEHSMQTHSLEGLDVILGGVQPFSVTVALNPDFDQCIIDAGIAINGSKEILPRCTNVTYIIPGISVNHCYLLPAKFSGDEGFNSNGVYSQRKPLENVKHDPFGSDVARIQLQQSPDFSGMIEFIWHGCVSHKSFSEYEVLIPFGAAERNGIEANSSQSFRVSMPISNEYRLIEHSVPIYGQKSFGDKSLYWFDIGKSNSVLHLVFESDRLKVTKQRLQLLCTAFFSLGLGVLVTQLIALYKHRVSMNAIANGGSVT